MKNAKRKCVRVMCYDKHVEVSQEDQVESVDGGLYMF